MAQQSTSFNPKWIAHSKPRFRLDLVPYLFILPAVALYVVFNLGPVLASFIFSFFEWDLLRPTAEFAGLDHYNYILNDNRFWSALSHNFIFLGLAVIIPVWIGLLLAVFIYEIRRGRVFFRAALFLPAIFSGVVIAFVWKWIYHPFAGVLNPILETIGLGAFTQSWLGDPKIALYSTFIAYAWATFGYSMVIFLAGLQDIPTDIFDAARVDGANFRQKLFQIIIPSLYDVFTFVITLRIFTAMGIFGVVFILTGGGPFYTSDVIDIYVFRMIGNFEMGWATAAATVNTVIVVCISTGFIKWRERRSWSS